MDRRHCFAKFISFLKTLGTDCVNGLSFPQTQPPPNSLSFSLHNETMVAAFSEKNPVCTHDLIFGLYNRTWQCLLYHVFQCILNQLKQPYMFLICKKNSNSSYNIFSTSDALLRNLEKLPNIQSVVHR